VSYLIIYVVDLF